MRKGIGTANVVPIPFYWSKIRITPHNSTKSVVDSAEACYNILSKLYAEKGWLFLMDQNIERWVSMKEITEYLGVSRDTILDWIDRRSMPAAKIGRLWKFKISEIDAWMKSGVAAEQ